MERADELPLLPEDDDENVLPGTLECFDGFRGTIRVDRRYAVERYVRIVPLSAGPLGINKVCRLETETEKCRSPRVSPPLTRTTIDTFPTDDTNRGKDDMFTTRLKSARGCLTMISFDGVLSLVELAPSSMMGRCYDSVVFLIVAKMNEGRQCVLRPDHTRNYP